MPDFHPHIWVQGGRLFNNHCILEPIVDTLLRQLLSFKRKDVVRRLEENNICFCRIITEPDLCTVFLNSYVVDQTFINLADNRVIPVFFQV